MTSVLALPSAGVAHAAECDRAGGGAGTDPGDTSGTDPGDTTSATSRTSRPRARKRYRWQSAATSRLDAGLARPDGSLLPSCAAMQRGIAGQPSAAASAPPAASTARWTATARPR